MDDLSTGSFRNVEHLNGGAFELVVASVDDAATMEGLVRRADLVYHLAAAVGVKLIVADPVRTIETNIRGTEVVLRLANKWRRPVVVASTSEVYGKSERVPYAEEHDMVLGPTSHSRWAYAASKAIDEFLAVAYFRRDGLPVVIARLFNTVGPRQTGRYGMVLPTFVRQALRGEPITVYGDGRQSRAFTYVGDAVRALLELPRHPAAFGEVFNVGGGREVTIMELARLVRERTGSASEIVMVPYDQAYAPGLRGHGPPGARHLQAAAGHRVQPVGEPGGDHRPGGRALPAEPGLRVDARRIAGLRRWRPGWPGPSCVFPCLGSSLHPGRLRGALAGRRRAPGRGSGHGGRVRRGGGASAGAACRGPGRCWPPPGRRSRWAWPTTCTPCPPGPSWPGRPGPGRCWRRWGSEPPCPGPRRWPGWRPSPGWWWPPTP